MSIQFFKISVVNNPILDLLNCNYVIYNLNYNSSHTNIIIFFSSLEQNRPVRESTITSDLFKQKKLSEN